MCAPAKRGERSRFGQRGQALVEFALVLPLLLMVLFIMVDFGVGFARWIAITNATREGARLAAVGADPAAITQKVVDTSNGVLNAGNVQVGYLDPDGDGVAIGDSVVVEADYDYPLITPLGKLLSDLTFDSIPFHSCADMRLEQIPGTTPAASGTCDSP